MIDDLSLYQHYLNMPKASFVRIEHPEAIVATVYLITQPNGNRFILKICDRSSDYVREIHFLTHFLGKISVPKIIQTIEPKPHLHGAILMEFFAGEHLLPNKMTNSLAQELGRVMALIHSNRLSGYGDPIKELTKHPKDYFYLKFEEGLEECSTVLPQYLIKKCLRYYKTHLFLLDSVDGPCIVHRDFRCGNIIISHGKLRGLIDWAAARAGFAEEDLCFLEQQNCFTQKSHKQAFFSGYSSIRPMPQYEPLLQLLALNKSIAIMGFTVRQGSWNTKNSSLYQLHHQLIEDIID